MCYSIVCLGQNCTIDQVTTLIELTTTVVEPGLAPHSPQCYTHIHTHAHIHTLTHSHSHSYTISLFLSLSLSLSLSHTHTLTLTLMNNCQELATLPHIGEHRGEGGERNQRTSGRSPMPSQVLRPSKPSSTVTDESTFFSVYLSPSTRTIVPLKSRVGQETAVTIRTVPKATCHTRNCMANGCTTSRR